MRAASNLLISLKHLVGSCTVQVSHSEVRQDWLNMFSPRLMTKFRKVIHQLSVAFKPFCLSHDKQILSTMTYNNHNFVNNIAGRFMSKPIERSRQIQLLRQGSIIDRHTHITCAVESSPTAVLNPALLDKNFP